MVARWTAAQLAGKQRARPKQTEHLLQAACVRWFRQTYRQHAFRLFAIPNGADLAGHDRMARAKKWRKLEEEGAVPGVADLLLAVPSGPLHGLFIEMKTPKGKQSEAQQRFEADMVWAGYGYAMPRTYEEFQTAVASYLERGEY